MAHAVGAIYSFARLLPAALLPAVAALTTLDVPAAARGGDAAAHEGGAAARGEDAAAQIAERKRALDAAAGSCDWEELMAAAEALLAVAPGGSDERLEALAGRAVALHQIWDPACQEIAGKELLSAADERRRADPRSAGGRLAPLPHPIASSVMLVRVFLAELAQARGKHEDAIGDLSLIQFELRRARIADSELLTAQVVLDIARSQLALGRAGEAKILLATLRDGFRGLTEGAWATVLLENEEGPGAYRGKYEGDPGHRRRMEELAAALPKARALLAERLGCRVEDIPSPILGVADRPAEVEAVGGHTTMDPRRPGFPPITVLYSEVLALGAHDPGRLLVHELVHAYLIKELGMRHESLPMWLIEGIPQYLAGELGDLPDVVLEHWFVGGMEALSSPGFASPDFWSRHPLELEARGCGKQTGPEEGLALLVLVERPKPGGWVRLVEELRAGRSAEEALRAATGLGIGDYVATAHARAMEVLEARRQESLPAVEDLRKARARGPREAVEAAERVLASNGPRLARNYALVVRADGLEGLGRREEALVAWRGLVASSRENPAFALIARMRVAGGWPLSGAGRRRSRG